MKRADVSIRIDRLDVDADGVRPSDGRQLEARISSALERRLPASPWSSAVAGAVARTVSRRIAEQKPGTLP